MAIRDIQIVQAEKVAQQEPKRNFTLAVIREVEGSVFYPYQPMHVWVSEWAQPQSYFGILNLRVPPLNGLQVMIGYPEKPPYTRQILDVWGGLISLPGYDPGDGGGAFSLPMHHGTHEQPSDTFFGSDVVRVYQPAIQPFKSFADDLTLTINVQSLRYWSAASNFRFFPGIGLDMTVNLPPDPATHRYVLIYLDRSSNTIARLEGTPVALALTPPFPQLPDFAIPSAFIRLEDGQTAINQVTDVVDARAFLGNYDVPGMDVFQWLWTDAADRLATAVSSDELFRIGLQMDDWTVWVLADDDPVTWEAISGGASGDFVLRAGDTMTGQLFIDGGADEVQLLVQGDAAQLSPILTVEDSAGSDLFTVTADGEILLALGVPIDEFSDDVTLGDDSSTALPTEHAVKTYVDGVIAAGPYVLKAGDTMTGQLFIDGGADEIQLLVQGNGTQTSPVVTIENSAGTDLLNVNNAGQLQLPTTGNTGGVLAGGDVHLYRGAANEWHTPDKVVILTGGSFQLPTGVTIDDISDDVTLGDDSSTAVPTEHAVKTYVDNAISAGPYVLKAGDTMTGQLFIDGGADEIQLLVQGNGTQTAPIVTIENSAGTDLLTLSNAGNLQLSSGVAINEFSDDVTLGGDSSTALPTEHAVKTYVDAIVISGPYVLKAGDTMTGQLFIDGGADEIQLLVQGNGTQTGPILTVESSAGADLFSVGSGVLVGTGTMPSAGSITVQNFVRINTLTTDRVVFVGSSGLLTDSSLLRWDSSNFRLGIGNIAPLTTLHVRSTDTTVPIITSQLTTNTQAVSVLSYVDSTTDGNSASLSFATNTSGTGAATQVTFSEVISRFDTHNNPTSTGSLLFNTRQLNALATRMTIGAGVLIGTGTVPAAGDLTVQDQIRVGNLTAGRVVYASTAGLLLDNANFLWDNTTTRLGIGVTPASPLHVLSTSQPISLFEHTSAATNTSVSVLVVKHTSSGAMVDGFGSNILFRARDSSAVDNDTGRISVVRDGADNQGKMLFAPRSSAGLLDRMAIDTAGRVGIGTTTPATSAILDLSSTTGALLLPRMTTAQRDALTAVNGMIIFNSTTTTIQARLGIAWVNL